MHFAQAVEPMPPVNSRSPLTKVGRPAIPALTGLRGIAALLIVVNHMTMLMLPLGVTAAKDALTNAGFMGMTVFFELSGFVMYYNYAARIAAAPRPGVAEFALARVARLYPLMITYVLVNFVINISQSTGQHGDKLVYVATLPFYLAGLQSWLYFILHGVNLTVSQRYGNPAWSVSTELFFYFLIFVPLILARRRGVFSLRYGLFTVVAAVVGRALFLEGAASSAVQGWIGTKLGVSASLGVYEWLAYYSPYGRCFEFIAGMGIAEIWLARRKVDNPVAIDWIGRAIGCCGLAYIVSSFFNGAAFSLPWMFEGRALQLGIIAAVPPLIYVLCCERGIASKLLSTAPLIFIGEISYSLYFVHTDIFPLFRVSPGIDLAAHIPMLISRCAVFLALAVLISLLTYRFIEKPARKMIMQAWTRRVPVLRPSSEH